MYCISDNNDNNMILVGTLCFLSTLHQWLDGRYLALFIYIFQYLALFTYIYPYLALLTLICLYVPLIALIWPYMPYSPYIDILLVRLHLCANILSDQKINYGDLLLSDINLIFKGHKSSKILR